MLLFKMNKMSKFKIALTTVSLSCLCMYSVNKYKKFQAKQISVKDYMKESVENLFYKISSHNKEDMDNCLVNNKKEQFLIFKMLYFVSMEKIVNGLLSLQDSQYILKIKDKIKSFDINQMKNKYLAKH